MNTLAYHTMYQLVDMFNTNILSGIYILTAFELCEIAGSTNRSGASEIILIFLVKFECVFSELIGVSSFFVFFFYIELSDCFRLTTLNIPLVPFISILSH